MATAYIDAVIFTKWVKEDMGNGEMANVPDAISDVNAWAIANDEFLPEGESGKGPFYRYEDLTGQANVHQRILDNLGVFAAKLQITPATAAHFASDPRFWTLGYRRVAVDPETREETVINSNWDEPLSSEQRQQAATYVTNNSNITAQQLAARFDVADTRLEVARKLKAFFKE